MSVDQTPPEPRLKPMTLTLAGIGVLAAGISLLPPASRPWNFSAIGALALFAAARLGFWPAIGLSCLALAVKDVGVYLNFDMEPQPLSWLCFAGYVALGWALLRRTESPVLIGASALGGGLVFFLTSNFVAWLQQAYPYGYSFAGLVDCYAAGIPFYRGTFVGDLAFSAALFGAHAVLARAYFPAERVAVAEVADRGERPA